MVHPQTSPASLFSPFAEPSNTADVTQVGGLGSMSHGEVRRPQSWRCTAAVLTFVAPVASADADVPPVGAVPMPDGPAPAWIVADMDTGQILAGRDQYVTHAPASTIKTLLALVVARRTPARRHGGRRRGRRQGGVQLRGREGGPDLHHAGAAGRSAAGVGQRRRQHPGPHARRQRRRGGEDERQGRRPRCRRNARRVAVRAQRARHRRLHHAARPRRDLPRRAGQPGVRARSPRRRPRRSPATPVP